MVLEQVGAVVLASAYGAAAAHSATAYWDQAAALAGRGGRARLGLHFKRRHPLPPRYRAGLLAAITVAGVLPCAEEFWRCWRSHPTTRPMPKPAFPATEALQISPEGEGIRSSR